MRGLFAAGVACVALGVAGCGPQKATAEAKGEPSVEVAVKREADLDKPDPRDAEIPLAKDGKPIWSANREHTAEENAKTAFARNGEAFGAKDIDDFIAKAHAFTAHPPAGTQKLSRQNGDTLLYDAKSNTFAVVTKDGAPRTMFHPDEGAAYWDKQKDREEARGKSRSKNRDEG